MISIITPFFNALNKINLLIDSLQKQTNIDFEWIIVDDCSEKEEYEGLKRKLEAFNFKYSLIRNQQNIGAGLSRNNGLKLCSGDYVVFVDSDDYVSEKFVEVICKNVVESQCDVFLFDSYRVFGNELRSNSTLISCNDEVCSVKDALINISSSVWCKAYRQSLIEQHQIAFPSFKRFEDWVFNTVFLLNASKIYYKKDNLYYYVDNSVSITHVFKNDIYKYALNAFDLFEKSLVAFDRDIAEFYYLKFILYVAAANEPKLLNVGDVKILISNLEQKYPEWNRNPYLKKLSKPQKLVFFLVNHKLWFALKMFVTLAR